MNNHLQQGRAKEWPVGRWELRFAMVGGGAAWLLHLVFAYVVAEFGCLAGLGQIRLLNITGVAWLLLGVTLLTLGIGGMATWLSWRCDGKILRAQETEEDMAGEKFTVSTGLLSNSVFVFIILVQSVPIFYFLHEC